MQEVTSVCTVQQVDQRVISEKSSSVSGSEARQTWRVAPDRRVTCRSERVCARERVSVVARSAPVRETRLIVL